jgi:uncharacterized protein YaaR (DUF327 family)
VLVFGGRRMKINRVDNKTRKIEGGSKERVAKSSEFADAFDNANRNQSEQQLQEMLKDIEKLGGRLTKTRTLEDAQSFRSKIKEYLTYIIKNAYIIKRDSTSFSFSMHTRIEVINEKLDELTKEVLGQQKEAIEHIGLRK